MVTQTPSAASFPSLSGQSFSSTSQPLALSIQPHLPQQQHNSHDFLQKFESAITTEYQHVTVKEEPVTPYDQPSSHLDEPISTIFDIHAATSTSSPQSGSCANSPCLSSKTFDTFFKPPTHNPYRHFSQASVFSGMDIDSGIDFTEELGTLSSTSSTMDLQFPDMIHNDSSQYNYELLDLDKFLTDPFTGDDGIGETQIMQKMLSDPLH